MFSLSPFVTLTEVRGEVGGVDVFVCKNGKCVGGEGQVPLVKETYVGVIWKERGRIVLRIQSKLIKTFWEGIMVKGGNLSWKL